MPVEVVILLLMVLAFAWSIGAHYTGACMGMPFGSGSIKLMPALVLMAPLALLGAVLASHGVESTVGLHIIDARKVSVVAAIVIIVAAFVLTTAYTALRIPTSTIQILVFCVVGTALGAGIAVHWATILKLAVVWVLAPPLALVLGFILTHALDTAVTFSSGKHPRRPDLLPTLSGLLVIVGAAASFTMGANDVSNATGVLIMTHSFNVWSAGLIGGSGIAIGVLTWGKPLLKRVAFDVVHVDLSMASAAQLVQALVVLLAVVFGFFTSMNQALLGAMMGAGLARGRSTIDWKAINGILRGWIIAPVSGIVIAFLLAKAVAIWFAL